jgi:cytosine/creatinine deaminase
VVNSGISGLVLANAAFDRGQHGNVRIVDGQVAAVGGDVGIQPGDDIVDLAGYLLLPGLVEPHVHLDKAFTWGRVVPDTGDLAGAIAAWIGLREQLSAEDFADRARRAALTYLANGATAIRAHTDVGAAIGATAFEAIRAVRDELAGVVDIEIVATANVPLTGLAGRDNLSALRHAIDAGADVVGGAPWLDPDPAAACDLLFDLAGSAGRPVDLHVDETTDPAADTLSFLIYLVGRGFPNAVTASHAVSLASRPLASRQRIADGLAEAGIAMITLPQTNLWLQGRDVGPAARRGLTAIAELRAAGVTVAAGGDNIRDPFNPLGRADPLETASLLAAAAHLAPAQALTAVSTNGWTALGRPPAALQPGSPAIFVAVAARDASDAVAGSPADRIVIRGHRIVARTSAAREYPTVTGALQSGQAARRHLSAVPTRSGDHHGLDPHHPAGRRERPPQGSL